MYRVIVLCLLFQDFSKWKNRRTSTKSDRRKSLDREHVITQMANGAGITFEKNKAQGGLLKRWVLLKNVMVNIKFTLKLFVGRTHLL